MLGGLPTSLIVNNKSFDIRTDYRDCLLIFEAYDDVDLADFEKTLIMLKILYKDYDKLGEDDFAEAQKQAIWFLSCGDSVGEPVSKKPVYNWKQDEQMIFSAINKVAGKEVRAIEYMHFWTFIGLFNEIGEGMFQSVVSIRMKKNKGKKLDKSEQEFYRNNKKIIDLKKPKTAQDIADLEALSIILNQ